MSDVRDPSSLIGEQKFGVGPAHVFFADEVLRGYTHIREEHLIQMVHTID